MSSAEAFNLLQKGIGAAKAGDKPQARGLLLEATQLDPNNELAWLWLAGVAENSAQALSCLEHALALNPNNVRAQEGLKRIQAASARPTAIWQCPFCHAEALQQFDRCQICKAILTMRDPMALLNNQVDEGLLQKGVLHLKNQIVQQDEFIHHYHLALAYLNLKQFSLAIEQLQIVQHLQPNREELAGQIGKVMNEIAALKKNSVPVSASAGKEKLPRQAIILAVDDSPTVRRLVALTLQKHGYQVVLAADGLEALSLLNDKTPDLILLDITMPRMDGYQLCKLIKDNQKTQHIPIIMLSGKDGFFDKVRGRMSGSTEYITKPFEPETLVETVKRYAATA